MPQVEQDVRKKCLEDLQSTTRYVTWSLHTKSRAGLRQMLSRVADHSDAPTSSSSTAGSGAGAAKPGESHALTLRARPYLAPSPWTLLSPAGTSSSGSAPAPGSRQDVVDMLENTLWNRRLSVMSEEVVAALVCQIFEGIRDHIVQSVELKFNCFFLMPVVDFFPTRLREELEAAYDEVSKGRREGCPPTLVPRLSVPATGPGRRVRCGGGAHLA